jgi:hypothetical protein
MLVNVMIEAATAQFKQKLEEFCEHESFEQLTAASAERMSFGLRGALARAGVAAYRNFLLAFEDARDIVLEQGEPFRFKAVREKSFLTAFGEMVLPRRCYQNKTDDKGYVPLDVAWGMQGQYMAPEVRETVLFSCGLMTPEETATVLKKASLFQPHATAIKHVVEKTGAAIEAHREDLDKAIREAETAPEQTQVLVTSLDGTTVLLNEQGAAMGRPAERPRGSGGDTPSSAYRTAMVGSISFYAPGTAEDKPQRLAGRYVAQMPEENCPAFKARVEAELAHAHDTCPEGTARILLMDGARPLWNYARQQPLFEGYHKLIDFWHTAEHLSLAAEALFGKGSQEGRQWYEKYRQELLDSDIGGYAVVRSMDYYAKKNQLSKSSQEALETQRTFFRRNAVRMEYNSFRQRGWPIGSGPVEAACKTLVKARLCRSGMRWSRRGGQNILTLRTYIKSGRWDAAWQQIKQLSAAA